MHHLEIKKGIQIHKIKIFDVFFGGKAVDSDKIVLWKLIQKFFVDRNTIL